MVFYAACAFVGLFCLIALGFGPLFFIVVGLALAVFTFRVRHEHWWGLPAAGAGAAFAAAVALGWRWHFAAGAPVLGFLLLAAARLAGRSADRRARTARR